jgi:aspartate-semialdehyde dehydrogenase
MNIGIVGATGLVGTEMIKLIENNHLNININNIKLFASMKSKGKKVLIKNNSITIEELNTESFNNLNIAIFCSSSEISLKYTEIANSKGCFVIDNSSVFRMMKNIPLVIPEINGDLVKLSNGIISNPNCCAALICMVLYPLQKIANIKRIIISTYQSASGAGKEAMDELINQIYQYSKNEKLNTEIFGRQYLLNVFSHNSNINLENGYNGEEMKIIEEINKILKSNIKISVTCVRVPVLRSHCASVNIEFDRKVDLNQIKDFLINQDGVDVIDNRKDNIFPEPINTENKHNVQVGRIRYDLSDNENKTINLFLSGDQLLKGAALNAYQILNLCQNINILNRYS